MGEGQLRPSAKGLTLLPCPQPPSSLRLHFVRQQQVLGPQGFVLGQPKGGAQGLCPDVFGQGLALQLLGRGVWARLGLPDWAGGGGGAGSRRARGKVPWDPSSSPRLSHHASSLTLTPPSHNALAIYVPASTKSASVILCPKACEPSCIPVSHHVTLQIP